MARIAQAIFTSAKEQRVKYTIPTTFDLTGRTTYAPRRHWFHGVRRQGTRSGIIAPLHYANVVKTIPSHLPKPVRTLCIPRLHHHNRVTEWSNWRVCFHTTDEIISTRADGVRHRELDVTVRQRFIT